MISFAFNNIFIFQTTQIIKQLAKYIVCKNVYILLNTQTIFLLQYIHYLFQNIQWNWIFPSSPIDFSTTDWKITEKIITQNLMHIVCLLLYKCIHVITREKL